MRNFADVAMVAKGTSSVKAAFSRTPEPERHAQVQHEQGAGSTHLAKRLLKKVNTQANFDHGVDINAIVAEGTSKLDAKGVDVAKAVSSGAEVEIVRKKKTGNSAKRGSFFGMKPSATHEVVVKEKPKTFAECEAQTDLSGEDVASLQAELTDLRQSSSANEDMAETVKRLQAQLEKIRSEAKSQSEREAELLSMKDKSHRSMMMMARAMAKEAKEKMEKDVEAKMEEMDKREQQVKQEREAYLEDSRLDLSELRAMFQIDQKWPCLIVQSQLHAAQPQDNEDFDCPLLVIAKPGERLGIGDSPRCNIKLSRDMPVGEGSKCEWCVLSGFENGSLQMSPPAADTTHRASIGSKGGGGLQVLVNGTPLKKQIMLDHLDVISFSESSTQLVVVLPKPPAPPRRSTTKTSYSASVARASVFSSSRGMASRRKTRINMKDIEENDSVRPSELLGLIPAPDLPVRCLRALCHKLRKTEERSETLTRKSNKKPGAGKDKDMKQLTVEDAKMITDQFEEIWEALLAQESEDRMEYLSLVYSNLRKQILDIAKRSGVLNALQILSHIKVALGQIEQANAIVSYLKPKIRVAVVSDDSIDEVREEKIFRVTHVEPRVISGIWHEASTHMRLSSIEDANILARNLFAVAVCCESISDLMIWTYDEFEHRLEWMEDVQATVQEKQDIHSEFFGSKAAQKAVAKMGVKVSQRTDAPEVLAGDWMLENPAQNPFQPMSQEIARLIKAGTEGSDSPGNNLAMLHQKKADRLQIRLNQALQDLAEEKQDNRNLRWHLAVRDKELQVEKESFEKAKGWLVRMEKQVIKEGDALQIAEDWLKDLGDEFATAIFDDNIAHMRQQASPEGRITMQTLDESTTSSTLDAASVFLALANAIRIRFDEEKQRLEATAKQVLEIEEKQLKVVVKKYIGNVDDNLVDSKSEKAGIRNRVQFTASDSSNTMEYFIEEQDDSPTSYLKLTRDDERSIRLNLRDQEREEEAGAQNTARSSVAKWHAAVQQRHRANERDLHVMRVRLKELQDEKLNLEQEVQRLRAEVEESQSRQQHDTRRTAREESVSPSAVPPPNVRKGSPAGEYGGCLFVKPSQNDCGWRRIAAAVNVWRCEVEKPLKQQLDSLKLRGDTLKLGDSSGFSRASTRATPDRVDFLLSPTSTLGPESPDPAERFRIRTPGVPEHGEISSADEGEPKHPRCKSSLK